MDIRCTVVFTALALSIPAGSDAHAGATPWAEDTGGRMRLIVTAPDADGRIRGALQVEPADGFITYWREPGESGIPPQISVSADSDVSLESIAYPVPKRIELTGVTDMGYDGPVTFPLMLKASPGTMPQLDVSAFIGLCKDICIPFQASFHVGKETYKASAVDNAILAVAATTLPEPPSDDFRIASAVITGEALTLALTLPDQTAPEITLASSDGFIVKAPEGSFQDGRYVITISASSLPDGAASLESEWLILVKTGDRALETPLVFERDAP